MRFMKILPSKSGPLDIVKSLRSHRDLTQPSYARLLFNLEETLDNFNRFSYQFYLVYITPFINVLRFFLSYTNAMSSGPDFDRDNKQISVNIPKHFIYLTTFAETALNI